LRLFAELHNTLCETGNDYVKQEAVINLLNNIEPPDVCYALNLLRGKKTKRLITPDVLKKWALEITAMPEWLFDECCQQTTDEAEVISLILPVIPDTPDLSLHYIIESLWLNTFLYSDGGKELIAGFWQKMTSSEIYLFNKLLTGSYNPNIKENILIKAIAEFSKVSETAISHRLKEFPEITEECYYRLISPDTADAEISRPYIFYTAENFNNNLIKTETAEHWQAEWNYNGLRIQLIKRSGKLFIWSGNGELITDNFPELASVAGMLPDGIAVDGHLIAWKNNEPLSPENIHKRTGKKNISKKLLEEIPVIMMVYDIMEYNYTDIRQKILNERRGLLEQIIKNCNKDVIRLSEIINCSEWSEFDKARANARNNLSDGIILKRKNSAYPEREGNTAWLKWKTDPVKVKAVLVYAARGSGEWNTLYSDYTFAVWKDDQLIPLVKSNAGLSEEEIKSIDDFVKKNTIEKFGPVRTVKPELVFEIEIWGVQKSSRRKSGLTVKNSLVLGRLYNTGIKEADNLENVTRQITL
jgi:DNA ligase-1